MAAIWKLIVILITVTLPLFGLHAVHTAFQSADETSTTATHAQTATFLGTTGQLRVWQPSTAVQTTVYLDGVSKGDWGFWSDMPEGNYSLTFSDVPGWHQPAQLRVLIYAIGSTIPERDYMLSAPWIIPVYAGKLTEVRIEFVQLVYLTHYQVVAQVRKAEEAGATSGEIAPLVAFLNLAIEMNEQALKLASPEDAQKRVGLLHQANETLEIVQSQASELEITASHRTMTGKIVAYVSGGIAAILATLACAFGLSFWRKYRVKRTFDMKVIPK